MKTDVSGSPCPSGPYPKAQTLGGGMADSGPATGTGSRLSAERNEDSPAVA